jgi:hypothetical protein
MVSVPFLVVRLPTVEYVDSGILVHIVWPGGAHGGEMIECRAIYIAAHARLEVKDLIVLVLMRMSLGQTYRATASLERTPALRTTAVVVIGRVVVLIVALGMVCLLFFAVAFTIAFVIACLLFAVAFILFFLALTIRAVMLE